MLPIIRKELSARRNSLIILCVVIVCLVTLYTSIFPAIQSQADKFNQLINSLGGVYKDLGIQGKISFDTLEHYMSTEWFGFTWPILAAVFMTAQAGSAIAGEIEKATIGMVLSLPIARWRIYLAKYAAGLLSLAIFVFVSVFTILPIAMLVGVHFLLMNFITIAVLCLLFGWAVYSFGLLLSTILNEKGHVYGVTGGIMLIMYVANAVSGLRPSLDWMKYGSLFHYFDGGSALGNNHISLASYLVFGGVAILSTLLGVTWFSRRDIIV